MTKYKHQKHRDSQRIDEVQIKTHYRYKESYMSGDEWRYSAVMTLMYKQNIVFTATFRNVETAMQIGYGAFVLRSENGNEYIHPDTSKLCDQEGCSEEAKHAFELLKRFDNEGHVLTKDYMTDEILFRKFCSKHKHRGDCGLEDATDNYKHLNINEVLK